VFDDRASPEERTPTKIPENISKRWLKFWKNHRRIKDKIKAILVTGTKAAKDSPPYIRPNGDQLAGGVPHITEGGAACHFPATWALLRGW
jgi:hypothetical protein